MAAIVASKVRRARAATADGQSDRGTIEIEIDSQGRVTRRLENGDVHEDKEKRPKNDTYSKGFSRKIPGNGKLANRNFRQSRQEQLDEAHANFRKKNKAKSGLLRRRSNSSTDIDELTGEDGVYRSTGSANVILYVGLGMIAIGLVITFVGLGDKGFKTLELKLIGPSLVGCGVFFALLRVLFCTVPSCCRACCCRKADDKEKLLKGAKTEKGSVIPSAGVGRSSARRRVNPASAASTLRSRHPNFVSDEDSDDDDNFRKREIKKRDSTNSNAVAPSSASGGIKAKPLSYDNYSTSSSSQFSDAGTPHYPDYSNVPKLPSLGGSNHNLQQEVVLNASKLHVETEKE